jgi:hypothetical protein
VQPDTSAAALLFAGGGGGGEGVTGPWVDRLGRDFEEVGGVVPLRFLLGRSVGGGLMVRGGGAGLSGAGAVAGRFRGGVQEVVLISRCHGVLGVIGGKAGGTA